MIQQGKKLSLLGAILTLLILGCPWLSTGQAWGESEAGRENLFLLGVDARALGMGGAYVSVTDGASSVYWNPAGLALLDKGEATFLHVSLWEETAYDFLGLAYPTLNLGTVGVGVIRLGSSDIPKRGSDMSELGTFDNTQSLYSISVASSFPLYTKGGMSLKIYNSSLDGNSATGIGLDLGILATPTEHLAWGINLQDLLRPKLQLKSKEERIPFNLKAGASCHFDSDPLGLIIAVDLDKTEDRRAKFHFGGELGIQKTLFVRGGYDRDYPTFGAGIKWNWFRTDYALKTHPDMGTTHRISVTIQFGKPLESRKLAQDQKTRKQAESLYQRENQQKITQYLSEARQQEEQGELVKAWESYNKVLALNNSHQFANDKVNALKQQIELQSQEKASGLTQTVLIHKNLERAKELYLKGSYKPALEQTEEVLNLDPNNPEALKLQEDLQVALREKISLLNKEANASYGLGNLDQAILTWTQVLQLDSTNQAAQEGLKKAGLQVKLNSYVRSGISYFNAGNYSASQREFVAALGISPNDPVAGDYLQKARAKMEKTTTLEDLKKDPQIWQVYQGGLEKYQKGDYQGAIQAWQEVLKAYPNNKNTLRNIDQAKLRLK